VVEADTKTVAAVELAYATGVVGAGICSVEQLTRVEGRTLAEACAVAAGAWVEAAGIASGGGAVEKFLDLEEHRCPQLLEACAVQLKFAPRSLRSKIMRTHLKYTLIYYFVQ
jgi:hypothetical protein